MDSSFLSMCITFLAFFFFLPYYIRFNIDSDYRRMMSKASDCGGDDFINNVLASLFSSPCQTTSRMKARSCPNRGKNMQVSSKL